jgi:hypothetical protein
MLLLFVPDLFYPVDNITVELFLNDDMRHGHRRQDSTPVLFSGSKPEHITRADFLDPPA